MDSRLAARRRRQEEEDEQFNCGYQPSSSTRRLPATMSNTISQRMTLIAIPPNDHDIATISHAETTITNQDQFPPMTAAATRTGASTVRPGRDPISQDTYTWHNSSPPTATRDAPPATRDAPPSTRDAPPSTHDAPPSTRDAPPPTRDAPPSYDAVMRNQTMYRTTKPTTPPPAYESSFGRH